MQLNAMTSGVVVTEVVAVVVGVVFSQLLNPPWIQVSVKALRRVAIDPQSSPPPYIT